LVLRSILGHGITMMTNGLQSTKSRQESREMTTISSWRLRTSNMLFPTMISLITTKTGSKNPTNRSVRVKNGLILSLFLDLNQFS